MEYLERYLLSIKRYLQKKDREDTINELRDLLLENFDNHPDQTLSDEDKILEVIKDFGMPYEVANRYNTHKPLVSKEYLPLFYMIMKIIGITLPGALLLANTIEYFTNEDTTSVLHFLLDTAYLIPSIIQAVIMAYACLLLVFVILSRYVEPKFDFKEDVFDPRTLPPIPEDVMTTKRWENILGIIGCIAFLYLFNLQPGLIAIYYNNVREPLLNESFNQLLPLINVSVVSSLGIHIFHLYKNRKTTTSATIEFFEGILSGIILILLAQRDIFNPVIIEGQNLEILPTIFTIVLWVGGIGSIIGSIVTYIKVQFRKEN